MKKIIKNSGFVAFIKSMHLALFFLATTNVLAQNTLVSPNTCTDLELAVSVSPTSVQIGQYVTYTMTVTNHSGMNGTGSISIANVPPTMTLTSSSTGLSVTGASSLTTRDVVVTGSLPFGSTSAVSYTLTFHATGVVTPFAPTCVLTGAGVVLGVRLYSGAGVNILWDFGDGATSTLRTPTHIFSDFCRHAVVLTLTSATGVCSTTQAVQAVCGNYHSYAGDIQVGSDQTIKTFSQLRAAYPNLVDAANGNLLSLQNHRLIVHQAFVIDENAIIKDGNGVGEDVLMLAGASIFINPQIRFALRGDANTAYINGTPCALWDGIIVGDGAIFEMSAAAITGAYRAIQPQSEAELWLENALLLDNYVGIYFDGANVNGAPSFKVSKFEHVDIANTVTALPKHWGCASTGSDSYAAIELHQCEYADFYTNTNPNNKNTFERCNYGVWSDNSVVAIGNTQIKDMQPFYPIGCTGDVCDPAGAAIYQIGGTVYIQDNLGSAGNNNSNANYSNYSFKNCKYGLYASRVFATVLRQTDIVACDYGVYIENSAADQNGGGGIILIEGNQIGKREIDASAGISTIKKIGVHLYQCDPMWYTEIAKNNIVVSDNASKGHESVGILLSGHGSTYGSGAIESNQIWAYNAVAGLGLLSIDKTYLHNNTINLTDATTNIAGMLLYAANATRMDCNTVTNYSLQTPNVFDEYGTRAYNIIASEGGSYDCNSSSGTYTGWLFQEPCIVNSKTTWANNHIGDHHWGVNFGGSLTINEFPHQGNTWWGQYTKAARHEGNINFFTGKVQGAIGANGNNLQQYPNPATMIETTYPGVTPANWFYDDWHQIPSCAASTQGVCSWWSLTGNGGDDNNMANQIAEGNINTAEYPAEVKRMEQLALYEKLRDGDIQNPTTAMWELKDSLDQTQAAAYYLTDQKTENVSKLAAAQKTQADLFLNSLKTTFGNLKQLDSLRQADTAQTAFYKTQATAKLHDLSNTNAQYKAFAQALEAARDTKSTLAKTANTGLTAIDLYEQNTKTTTDIYLSTIGKGHSNFTPQQAADLQTVANQCPLTGGPAVHEARAMASKLGFKVHNDKALCAVQGVNYRAVKPKEEVKETLGLAFNVYPNPADGIVNIQANQALAGDGELQIYDIYGRLTVRMPLINNTNGLGFDVTAWTAGQYAYKIILSNGYTSIGKFIVVK